MAGYVKRHLTEEELRHCYHQPLAALEMLLLQRHLTHLTNPDRPDTDDELDEEVRARAAIKRLEEDLARHLGVEGL